MENPKRKSYVFEGLKKVIEDACDETAKFCNSHKSGAKKKWVISVALQMEWF